MDIRRDARVTVTCDGEVRRGVIFMCSDNRVSLLLALDDALPLGVPFFTTFVPVVLREDGKYHQVIGGQVVDIVTLSEPLETGTEQERRSAQR